MKTKVHFAHSSAEVPRENWHLLQDHLKDTGNRAARFLEPFRANLIAYIAGLLHDVGKYSAEFQRMIRGEKARVDHSTAGALIASEHYRGALGRMLAYTIAGHHAGLADWTGEGRITPVEDRLGNKETPKLDEIWKDEIGPLPSEKDCRWTPKPGEEGDPFCLQMLTRMVFSALVDADYLDTEHWYAKAEGRAPPPRGGHPSLEELRGRLDAHLEGLMEGADDLPVNHLRREVLEHVRTGADMAPGAFSLTVPTGGGKTLASLAFALDHAIRHELSRVIYVIPFTSVAEQTASVFREALRDGRSVDTTFVVEHHSAFEDLEGIGREGREKLNLAMESWDAPIIVTTAVQLFESLFSNRVSRCRKVHNIAGSVVVLDEAQTLPLRLLRPCVAALDDLAASWRTSVVVCTATQPAIGEGQHLKGVSLRGIRELAPEPDRLHQKLRRTRIRHIGRLDDEELARRMVPHHQALCIVNTRRHARELYEKVRGGEGEFHLTTKMCPRHRSEVLARIRTRLRRGDRVLLVATSLVEAGIDLDFPRVMRAEAGLESLIQAAGRCNREGRLDGLGEVEVFEPAPGEGRRPPPEIGQKADVARAVIRGHKEDPAALAAIEDYFKGIYEITGDNLDRKRILQRIKKGGNECRFDFETIARHFQMIETPLVPVIVPYTGEREEESKVSRLVAELESGGSVGRTARKLQPYAVPIPLRARDRMAASGAVRYVCEGRLGKQFAILENLDLYSTETGLDWDDPAAMDAESLVL